MSTAEAPWHGAFPEPKTAAPIMPQRKLMQMLSLQGLASVLVIDVRRTDYEGGCIRGSLNIPAQGFWYNRGMLYELAYKADMQWIVFLCGSSNGRGPRCAAWFLEHVRSVGNEDMGVLTLEGGIKGWVKAGPQCIRLMDGYDEAYWKDLFASEKGAKATSSGPGQSETVQAGKGDMAQ